MYADRLYLLPSFTKVHIVGHVSSNAKHHVFAAISRGPDALCSTQFVCSELSKDVSLDVLKSIHVDITLQLRLNAFGFGSGSLVADLCLHPIYFKYGLEGHGRTSYSSANCPVPVATRAPVSASTMEGQSESYRRCRRRTSYTIRFTAARHKLTASTVVSQSCYWRCRPA